MAIPHTTGGTDYEIEVPGCPLKDGPDDVFYYRTQVKKKAATDFVTLTDPADAKRPMIYSTEQLALIAAKEWLDKNGPNLPNK